MTTITDESPIDFGAITGSDDGTPKGKFDAALEKADLSNLQTLSCIDWLTPAQQEQVRAEGKRFALIILEDESVLDSFGNPAMNGINQAVNNVAARQRKMRIPEVERITKEMSKTLNDFSRKYNTSDPKYQAAMENFIGFVKKLVGSVDNFIQEMYVDSQSAFTRLDKSAGTLVKYRDEMIESVQTCRVLYEENEAALRNIVVVIAMMEEIGANFDVEIATAQQELEGLTEGSGPWRDKREELDTLLELRRTLSNRRSAFIQRMQVGWSSSPRLRNMGRTNKSLAERLGLLVDIMVPAMRETIVQWGELIRGEEAGKAIDVMDTALNDVLQGLAKASATSIPRNMALAQRPMVTPETINVMAESIVAQNDGLLQVFELSKRAHAEVEDASVKAIETINASETRFQERVVELYASTKKVEQLTFEPVAELPEPALAYASQHPKATV